MIFMGPNPWSDLKLKPLTPEQEARFRELVSRPIIDWYMWIDDKGKVLYASDQDNEVEQ